MSSIEQLVKRSNLIFAGKVVARGVSSVLHLPPRDNFVVVRVERGIRVPSTVGEINGRKVTLVTLGDELSFGQEAVFFTQSLTYGREITAREMGHVGMEHEDEVTATVSRYSDLHLAQRLNRAELVVLAEVTRVKPLAVGPAEYSAARWSMATLHVEYVLKGQARVTHVFFPIDQAFPWYDAPSFRLRQRGIFLLHRDDPRSAPWLSQKNLGFVALTALDPADFQNKTKLNYLRKWLRPNEGVVDGPVQSVCSPLS